jgi:hypothetical protein
MNNSILEQALVTWLTAAGVSPVLSGASSDQIAPDQLVVIASVPDIEHVVGPLHKATVNLIVSAPAYHTDLANYRTAAIAIRSALAAHATNGLFEALATAGATFGGLHIGTSSELIEDNRWINSISCSVGMMDA